MLAFCSLVWVSVAAAQAPKGDAAVVQTLRKAQGMLRQLSQEKADLEAKNIALEEQIKALDARVYQLEPLQAQFKQAKAGLEALQGSNAALQQQLGGQISRLQTVTEEQRKAAGELARYKRDNRLLVDAVNERTRWIEGCAAKNQSLVRTNREIIDKFGTRSFWDSLKEAEPLTGIGDVARENAAQEFQYKLDNLEVTPWKESQTAVPPQAPEAASKTKSMDENGE